MAEGKTSENPIWSPIDIANNANNWTLASDASLLRYLEDFSETLLAQASKTNDKLDNLLTSLDETSLSLDLARNDFSSLSNTQFIESRIYEDDETVENQQNADENDGETTKNEGISKEDLKKAALKGLEVIDKYFDKVEVPHSDSEDETDFPSYVLRPKDLYMHRPLPYVIGTEEWYKSPNAGLADSSSDSEEDKVSEKFSDDSDSEVELPKPKEKTAPLDDSESSEDGFEKSLQQPVANSTFNDTRNLENTTEYNSVYVQAPSSQQVFAEQLAKKLGKVLEENEPEINRKPIQKPQNNYGKLFSEEPPPIEENDDDMFASPEKKHGIFSGGDGLFDDLEDDVSFWGAKTDPKKSQPASSEREKVVPNLFDDDPDDIFVKPKPAVSTNNNFKAELDKKLKTPKNLFDASSSSDDDLFANKTEEKQSNSQRILTSTEKAPPIVSNKPSGFDDGDSSSDDMFSTNNKRAKIQENIEDKSSKSENSEQRKAPVGGVKIMANPNFLQDKEFNKLLKTRKQYSSDTSSDDKEEISETNGTKEETKSKVSVESKPGTKKPEIKAKIEEETKPRIEETSNIFEEKGIKSTNVAKISTESKKISLFDDDDDDLFKDDLFSASSGTKKSSNTFTEDTKPKNLFDDTSNSIFDDDILISAKEDKQAKKAEETSKKNVLEDNTKTISDKTKMQKKALSLFDEDEDSDDFFSSNVVKRKSQDLKNKEDMYKDTVYNQEKVKKISLFDDEDDDIFSTNVFLKKESKKAQNKLFFDEPEEKSLFENEKKSGLFSVDDLFLDKSLKKQEEIVEENEEVPNGILKNGDDQGKIEETNEGLQKGESIFEDVQPKNEEIDDFIDRNVTEERIIDDEIRDKIIEEDTKIEEEIKVDKEGIKIEEAGNKREEEFEHREETEVRKNEEINSSEEINDTKSNHNSLETQNTIQKEDSRKLEEEITKEIEEITPKTKVITQRIIQESEYDFEPRPDKKPNFKSEENNQIKENLPNPKEENRKEETPEYLFEEIPEFLDDIPPVQNIFEDNSPQNDIFASLTENEEISKNVEDTKSGDRRLLFDSSPPPDIDTWEPDNFEDDIYSFDNTESVLGGQRSSIFDREPPSLFINQSSGIVIEQETRLETDNVSSFYPYACSSRRFSADTFGEDYSDDSLFKKNSHTISNIPTSSKKIEEVSSFLDITPSGKYSELYSEITDRDLKPRKSVTFDDDVKKFSGEDSSLKKEEMFDDKVEEIGTKMEESVKENCDVEEIGESLNQLVFKKQDEEMKNYALKISTEKDKNPVPNILPKPTVPPRKENLTGQDREKIDETPSPEPKEKSSPGKLKHNLNINVQALLPGMVPLRPNTGRPPRPTTIAAPSDFSDQMPNQNSQIRFQLPRIDLVKPSNIPNTQKTDKVDPEVLQSVTKTRARIPNRRPSTKRGREAFRKSCVDFVVTHDEEDPEPLEENQPAEKAVSLPSSPNFDLLTDLTPNLETRRPSTPNSPPPPLPSVPPPSMVTLPLEIPKDVEEQMPEKRSFVKTDDFASPEFYFNKPDLFSENDNDDDLFSEKKLPPKSNILTTSLFGDDDDDDFLQSVGSMKKNDAKPKPESSSLSSASTRRPKSVVMKKLENIEVTDDPLSAFDQ